jgi:hypothetical protein
MQRRKRATLKKQEWYPVYYSGFLIAQAWKPDMESAWILMMAQPMGRA